MRGRLIFPQVADIAQLDMLATAQDPDDTGSLTSGYDDIFMEPVRVPSTAADPLNSPRGSSARVESLLTNLPCQIEDENLEVLNMMPAGNTPGGRVLLIFHFSDLESRGLVDGVTGEPLIRVNDRLVRVRHLRTKKLIQEFPDPPGLYAQEVRPISFGLSGGDRNLLLVRFEDREQSVRG